MEKRFTFTPSERLRFEAYWRLGLPTSPKRPTYWAPGEPLEEFPLPVGMLHSPKKEEYISPLKGIYQILGEKEARRYEAWLFQEKKTVI